MATEFKLDFSKLKNIKLTQQQQQMVVMTVIAVGGAVYGYWNYLITPMNADIKTVSEKLKNNKEDLKKAKEFKANWTLYKQRLAKVQEAAKFVAKRLPSSTDSFVEGVQRVMKISLEGEIKVTPYSQMKTKKKEIEFPGFQKNIAELSVSTEFHKLGEFLSTLSGENILYNVENVTLRTSGPNQQHHTVAATMDLVTYMDLAKK